LPDAVSALSVFDDDESMTNPDSPLPSARSDESVFAVEPEASANPS